MARYAAVADVCEPILREPATLPKWMDLVSSTIPPAAIEGEILETAALAHEAHAPVVAKGVKRDEQRLACERAGVDARADFAEFADILVPGGLLFLGATETSFFESVDFGFRIVSPSI